MPGEEPFTLFTLLVVLISFEVAVRLIRQGVEW